MCKTDMAKRNYLVDGLSGVGTSSVYEELMRRGFSAISSDRVWAYHGDPETGLAGAPVGHDTWIWDQQVAQRELLVNEKISLSCADWLRQGAVTPPTCWPS